MITVIPVFVGADVPDHPPVGCWLVRGTILAAARIRNDETGRISVIARREAPWQSRAVGNGGTWIASPSARNDEDGA